MRDPLREMLLAGLAGGVFLVGLFILITVSLCGLVRVLEWMLS